MRLRTPCKVYGSPAADGREQRCIEGHQDLERLHIVRDARYLTGVAIWHGGGPAQPRGVWRPDPPRGDLSQLLLFGR